MKRSVVTVFFVVLLAIPICAQKPPLLPEETVAALEQELSGETAKRNLEFVSRQHRTRGSRPLRVALDHIIAQAKAYGLSDAQVLEFPADGKTSTARSGRARRGTRSLPSCGRCRSATASGCVLRATRAGMPLPLPWRKTVKAQRLQQI